MNLTMLVLAMLLTASPLDLTEDQRALYSIGYEQGLHFKPYGLTAREVDSVFRGIVDGAHGKAKLSPAGPAVETLLRRHKQKANAAILKAAASEPGAYLAPRGWVMRVLKEGTGPTPTANSSVRLRFRGMRSDGTEFESTFRRHATAVVGVGWVVPCWTEALQKMRTGQQIKLTCPSESAFGDDGHPPLIPPGEALTFEIELIDFKDNGPDAGVIYPTTIPEP